jgi:3',5'-nucleoside bisphosphate phosphatase
LHVHADLHIHTQASDGDLSPDQIVSLAKYSGLDTIAVTDHDTLSGAREAIEPAKRKNILSIPGVEISIAHDPGTLHILGYFPSFPQDFEKVLKRLQDARTVRLPRIIEKLNSLGVDISVSDVTDIAQDGQIGRPHIAKALVRKGYVQEFDEAFTRYLAKGKPAYVEKDKMNSREAIEAILGYGGLPVLAHPFTLCLAAPEAKGFIGDLAGQGLKGIEIFYPDHTKAQKKLYAGIARELGLVVTGGTDYHGAGKKGTSLGKYGLDEPGLSEFLKRLYGQVQ